MICYRLNITDEINQKRLEIAYKHPANRRRQRQIRRLFAVLGSASLLFGLFLISQDFSLGRTLLICALIYFVMLLILPKAQKHRLRKQMIEADQSFSYDSIDYRFAQDGVSISSSLGESQLRWDAFCSYEVDDGFLCLMRRDNHIILVKLSELPQADQEALLQLIAANVKNA